VTFSEIFIRRPIMTTLVMVVMAVFGVWSYFKLPVNSLPTVDYPVIQVTVAYPGASPATMASAVATPLENQFTQINGLQAMISDNKENVSTINLTFSLERNVDLVAPDVQAAITRAQNNLPKDLPNPPTYQKYNPSDAPIYYLMLYSDTLSHGDLYDFANHIIAKKLTMIEGVSQVQTFGAQRAVRIQFIPEQLAAYEIGIDELTAALKAGTVNIPGGSLNGPGRTFSLEPQGQLRTGREYGELIIAYRNNAPVRLKDVANCIDSIANDLVDIRFRKPGMKEKSMCVVMAVSRVSGANTVKVASQIEATLAQARRELPRAIKYETLHNGADPIRESIEDVQETVVIALVLVVLVMFMFLGRIRETVVPGIVLPVSILGTLILMLASDFSLDTLSLMGIVLAVGFLVDDAIVVLENTVRHMEAGVKPIPAAVQSMKEITFTVISTSVALIIVFAPLVFMSGALGRNLREFALTVIYAVVVSTIVALTLSPMMCARIIKQGRAPNRIQQIISATIAGLVNQYGKALKWTLQHKFVSLLAWIVCIAGTVWLFLVLPQDFLPKGDSSFIHGAMLMPQGASTAQMRAYQKQVLDILSDEPDIVQAANVSGVQPGADQSMGFVFVHLKPPGERKYPIEHYTQKLMGRLMALPSGFCFLQAMPVLKISSGAESTAAGSDYAYLLMGLDRDKVYATAKQLEVAMRGVPGFINVQNNIKLTMPRLNMEIDRERASALGLTAQAIEAALALGYAGGYVTQFTTDLDQYQVIPEVEKEHQAVPNDLHMLYLRSPVTGKLVPLKSVVSWREEAGPQSVPHCEQQESATLSFSLYPGIPLGYATKQMEELAAKILPQGVTGRFTGDAQEFMRSILSLGILLLVAIFLKYIVLGILYESYIHPFTILTTLPVAVFGGLLTLFAMRPLLVPRGVSCELSIYAYIGMFVLIGLITKNGILMVDFAEQRRGEGMSSFDAIYDACLVRFRPILMTGLCAILGTLPIALGYGADAASRIPLGLVVVGGMIFAQIITLFVTPGIFLFMDRIQERFFKPRTDLE
jgi:HAE1 family hydrophobic/amphiphilic exporter-1